MKKLCLAGGVFLNVLANAERVKIPDVQAIFIQPASHDAGTAIGAAALSWIKNGGSKISYDPMFLGTEYDDVKIENALVKKGDRVAYELPVDFIEEEITSLQLDGNTVEEINQGQMAGIKTTLTKEEGRKGIKVYLVK